MNDENNINMSYSEGTNFLDGKVAVLWSSMNLCIINHWVYNTNNTKDEHQVHIKIINNIATNIIVA